MELTYGDMLDAVAPLRSDRLALSTDDGDFTWAEFDQRTNALARGLIAQGLKPGDKICFLLANGGPFVELLAACFKGRFVHVNANFRYRSHEIEYILENSDSVALVYDPRFSDQVSGVRPDILKGLVLIEGGSHLSPSTGHMTTSQLIEQSHNQQSQSVKLVVYTFS